MNRTTRAVFQLLMGSVAISLLLSCAQPQFQHQAYLWQRQWTPAVSNALSAQSASFSGWRVLGLQVVGTRFVKAGPDLAALKRSGKALRLVVRIEGARLPIDVPTLLTTLNPLIAQWRAAQLPLLGIEIDHDCASAALGDYAPWLRALRGALAADLKLSITALPTWLESEALSAVLAAVDDSVLQVHAVERPDRALFDPQRALQWTRSYAERAPHPFWIALPAYGVRVASTAQGQVVAVDAEGLFDHSGAAGRELRADPRQVADYLAKLPRSAQLQGFVWFRLPLQGDRRAWSATTLAAVIARQPLTARFVVAARVAANGAFDLSVRNIGNLDAPAPSIELPASCRLADGLGRYRVQQEAAALRLLPSDAWLAVGEVARVGWARCDLALAQEWSL